jgi:3-oxoacyl-[acyl-carrier-protein] synthase-1/3-oxoacyl-[acyl-carrier-protein] synthase II
VTAGVAVVAFGAISALGEGDAAVHGGLPGAPAATAVAHDPELDAAGLTRPFLARAPIEGLVDRAPRLLERALVACAADLDRARPGWRTRGVGLVLGTSSGGMRAAERAFARVDAGQPVDAPEQATYYGPTLGASRALGVALEPCVLVLGACASSALAIGLACRWLARGSCDLVLAGGFDDVTVFVGAGFEALRAITASPPPRPFRAGRDGMALGEGAGVLALELAGHGPARAFITGFAATSDAVHLTAPDREGTGLARAAEGALAEAGRPEVDLVSAHGTATPFNDAAEARAIAAALGPERARRVVVHPFKAQIGHTLGAASALELLACVDAIARGVLPAACGDGGIDPDASVRLLARAERGEPRTALKLAAAFGGANAALVVGSSPGRVVAPRPPRPVYLHQAARIDGEPAIEALASKLGLQVDRVARADGLARLALAAVARLREDTGPFGHAGVVVGTTLATLETNAAFAARIRARGAVAAEPRRFPYTSPNAVAGECSIAFGLRGPSFAVGGGTHAAVEAIAAATVLIEAGDADRIVVVAADEVGPAARAMGLARVGSGAVALLLDAERSPSARARVTGLRIARGEGVGRLERDDGAGPRGAVAGDAVGHTALWPLVGGPVPSAIASASPDVRARLDFETV